MHRQPGTVGNDHEPCWATEQQATEPRPRTQSRSPNRWFEIADLEPNPFKLFSVQTCQAAQTHICTFQSPLSFRSKDKRGQQGAPTKLRVVLG